MSSTLRLSESLNPHTWGVVEHTPDGGWHSPIAEGDSCWEWASPSNRLDPRDVEAAVGSLREECQIAVGAVREECQTAIAALSHKCQTDAHVAAIRRELCDELRQNCREWLQEAARVQEEALKDGLARITGQMNQKSTALSNYQRLNADSQQQCRTWVDDSLGRIDTLRTQRSDQEASFETSVATTFAAQIASLRLELQTAISALTLRQSDVAAKLQRSEEVVNVAAIRRELYDTLAQNCHELVQEAARVQHRDWESSLEATVRETAVEAAVEAARQEMQRKEGDESVRQQFQRNALDVATESLRSESFEPSLGLSYAQEDIARGAHAERLEARKNWRLCTADGTYHIK